MVLGAAAAQCLRGGRIRGPITIFGDTQLGASGNRKAGKPQLGAAAPIRLMEVSSSGHPFFFGW